uniref:Predicted phosphatases n=1 Tax=uncultured gamma proteobacterium HF0500_32L01 TaxID=723574 RepID=E7C5Z3_9GAMM|nr:predicted phosphatases [uncultured gamma proteobacterium HF0500_32L01]
MAILKLRDCVFDTKVIVFDKDGTLIDFNTIWGSRMVSATESMVLACQGGDDLRSRIFHTVGYSLELNETLGCGPLATAPIVQLETIVATVLHQAGIRWDAAISLAAEHLTKKMVALPTTDEISPRADLTSLFQLLRDAKIRLAVATTDNRLLAEKCLEVIGIKSLVEQLLCGDDENGPRKPDPAVLHRIAEFFDEPVNRLVMVGDTVSDLEMAKTVGAVAVAITGGAGSRSELEQQADVVIDSLEEICVV